MIGNFQHHMEQEGYCQGIKQQISLGEFEESMKSVFTTCVGESTLDEAPQAYKPIEDILQYINDTIDIIEVIKPIYNFKSN